MSIKYTGKVELTPKLTNSHLMYKRTKHLFNISKFVPEEKLKTITVRQHTTKRNPFVGFINEAYRKMTNFKLFPVVYAKLLTPEQIAELQKERQELKGTVSEREIMDFLSKETGKDRLYRMLQKDHKGDTSPELSFVWNHSFKTGMVAYIFFYVMKFRESQRNFIKENRGATYATNFMAGRRIRDRVNTGAMKHGAIWGFKIFALVGSVLFISQSIAVYRNKTSAWEYIIATGIGCSLNRFYFGPRGMFSGLVIGTLIGIPVGLTTYLALTSYGETQEERHYRDVTDLLVSQRRLRGEYKPQVTDQSTE